MQIPSYPSIRMTVISDLPLELLLVIIEYLDDDDGSNNGSLFSSVNRNFSRVLLKDQIGHR